MRAAAEVTVVAGYYVDQRGIGAVVDEVSLLKDAGCKRVKIMLKGDDAVFDHKYCSAVVEKMPGQVAADAHWTWNTLTEARKVCRQLDGLGLGFLEDPFAASDVRLTHELRRDLVTPIAAGEDTFGPRVVSELVSGIDILRVDATTVGGITGAIEAINLAAGAGKTVFPHVFAPLHVHLACAFPNVEAVEWITPECGADPLNLMLPQHSGSEGRANEAEPGTGHRHLSGLGSSGTALAAASRGNSRQLREPSPSACFSERLAMREAYAFWPDGRRQARLLQQGFAVFGIIRINRQDVSQPWDGLVCSAQLAQEKSCISLENNVGDVYFRCLIEMFQSSSKIPFLFQQDTRIVQDKGLCLSVISARLLASKSSSVF